MNQDKLPRGDTAIVERVSQITGFRREEARISYQATMAAVREKLEAGEEVVIPGAGRFVFMMAKPRTIPANNGRPKLSLSERPILKFRPLEPFRHLLKSVKPKNPRRHQRWSDARKAAKLASQILKSEQTASPNTPLGRGLSVQLKPVHSSHSQHPIPDKDGTPSGFGYTPDSTGTSTNAPSAPPLEPAREIESTPSQCETELRSSAIGTVPPAEAL